MQIHITRQKISAVLIMAGVVSLIPFLSASAAGIVPCGGPGQTECSICWFFVLMRAVIDFILFKAATALAAVFLAIGGFLFLTSGSDPGRYETGKSIVTNVFKGYLVMLAGWLFINTFFMAFGVTEWSGLKEGWWKVKATCAAHEDAVLDCGDGKITGDEECDPRQTVKDCQARTGYTKNDCENFISRCIEITCKLEPLNVEPDNDDNDDVVPPDDGDDTGCKDNEGKIGQGCYLDEDGNGSIDSSECKKGKYVCDAVTKKLKCEGDGTILDYCCSNDLSELADGKIGGKPFTIVRATPQDIHLTGGKTIELAPGIPISLDNNTGLHGTGFKGGFNCDEVCKKTGKICVGVGLTDPSKNACVYEVHDTRAIVPDAAKCNNAGNSIISMQISDNQSYNDCKAFFSFMYYSFNNERWSTAYDKYEYFCRKYDPKNIWNTPPNDPSYGLGNEVPDNSCGVCKPKAAIGEICTGFKYKQDPSDTCAFHGNDLGETACYCY